MQFTIFTATIMHLVLPPPPPQPPRSCITIVFEFLRQLWYPGELGNNAYANFFLGARGVNKVHYGLCEDGESKN